jgi:hypothetical protein
VPTPIRLRQLLAGVVLGLAGCGFDPEGDVPMNPPAVYREWWAKTEACSGISKPFEQVRWYEIEGEGFPCPSGTCAGRWQKEHTIYLASRWAQHEMVVRHEMLHALIGEPGHPPELFEQACPLTWTTWPGAASTSVAAKPAAELD